MRHAQQGRRWAAISGTVSDETFNTSRANHRHLPFARKDQSSNGKNGFPKAEKIRATSGFDHVVFADLQ